MQQASTSNNQCHSLIPVLKSKKIPKKRASNIEGEITNKSSATNINNNKKGKIDKTTVVNSNSKRGKDTIHTVHSEPGPSKINQRSNSRSKNTRNSNNVIKSNLLETDEYGNNIEQNKVNKLKKFNTRNTNLNAVNNRDSINNLNGVTSNIIKHNYKLRSQGKYSDITLGNEENNKNTQPTTSSALGASTSQTSKREDSLSSRLTRTGAVLRRSTRNIKCK